MPIHSYHCHCTQLLLLTPYSLSTLQQRAAPSQDKAYILPLLSQQPDLLDSMLPSTTLAPPIIIKREDGFEKRWQRKCARCQLTFGYHLGVAQFAGSEGSGGGRRTDVLYVLPGSLRASEELAAGEGVA